MKEQDILDLIRRDTWMMDALHAARSLKLPDWMIGAGFVRGKIWDVLHGYTERTPLPDIDLVYFDASDVREEKEKEYDRQLRQKFDATWSTKNQARMHIVNGESPYRSSEDGVAHWIETPTCIAVTLEDDETLRLVAPYGIDDLINLRVRPIPTERGRRLFPSRMAKKNWRAIWPRLTIMKT